jgi:hypothetical protein
MQPKTLPRVASNVYLPCAGCARSTYHRVLAHTSSMSAKTQCEICGRKKTFKLESSVGSKKTTVRKSPATVSTNKQFDELLAEFGSTEVAYSISGNFEKDTVISHPKFGRGVVTATYGDKMAVLFRDGMRDLIQNRK